MKRILSILLVFILFAGCGAKGDPPTEPEEPETAMQSEIVDETVNTDEESAEETEAAEGVPVANEAETDISQENNTADNTEKSDDSNAEIVNNSEETTANSSAEPSPAVETSSWNADAVINLDTKTATGKGVNISGSTVTIGSAGTYLLSGTFIGQVIVNAGSKDKVVLVLNGVNITAEKNAAIYASQCDRLTITLADGSVNTLSDAAGFSYSDAANKEPDAAVFAKDDLTINGSGTLTVNAGFNNGIGTKDDLLIEGGIINITAANHGIRGRDSLTVEAGALTINAGNDGLQSNNDEDASKGWINLASGRYSITAANDGIQAETDLTITGGSYSITTGGGASGKVNSTDSYKGLKAGNSIVVKDGSFTLNTADDGVHSNGDIHISGGSFEISSGDDGFHADDNLLISGGSINITRSYEGIEAHYITVTGGDTRLVSTDDGVNVAGGNDGNGGFFGGDRFGSGDGVLTISGGSIFVDAAGDGIDVNGSAEITGGVIYVDGPTNSGNGALDFDNTFNISGGTLIAAGSSGMAQSPSASSPQGVIMLYFTSQQQAGTKIAVLDASGNKLAEYTPSKTFQSVVITAPGMSQGGSYTIQTGGNDLLTVTLDSIVTSISDTGDPMRGGEGGRGGGFMDDTRPSEGGKPPGRQ